MLVGQCEVILTKPDQTECVLLKLVVIRASTGRCSSLIRANALIYDGDNLKKGYLLPVIFLSILCQLERVWRPREWTEYVYRVGK